MFDILSAITPLSLAFQLQDSTPQSNNEAIHKSLRKLQKLKKNGFPTANITKQQMSVNENQGPFSKFFYKQEQLIKPRGRRAMPEEPDLDQLFNGKKNDAETFVDELIASIQSRFDLTHNPIVKATRIMHLKFKPLSDPDGLLTYGDKDVQAFSGHFDQLLVSKGCNTHAIASEWDEVKAFIQEKKQVQPQLSDLDVWTLSWPMCFFSNFNFIIILMLVLPTNTADCERGFSLMKRFKTALRSKMKIPFISAMMAVKLNTAEEGEFNPEPFVKSWWAKKQRRLGGDGIKKQQAAPSQDNEEDIEEVVLVNNTDMPYYG